MSGTEAAQEGQFKTLRILAVHRYYWPDTPPYASMLRRIVGRWQQDGHQVEILSSQPSYKADLENQSRPQVETIDGIRVERLTLPTEAGRPLVRIVNAFRLGMAVLWRAFRRHYDVIMISTAPPVLGGLAAALAARLIKARFIYHCMDIQPEVGRVSGEFSHSLVYTLLRRLDGWSCRQADPVVVLSRDMEKTLNERSRGQDYIIKVLNNFSLPADDSDADDLPFTPAEDRLTILFAGNLGRFQGLETLVEVMGRLKDRDDIECIMMGEGVAKAELQNKARQLKARVRFVGHQPATTAKAVMHLVDAGFVGLIPDIYRFAYPSKTMTYLEQGCPVIVAVEPESELARDVLECGYGFNVPVQDSSALADLLVRLAEDRSWQSKMKMNAKKKAEASYSEAVVLNEWSALLLNHD